MPAQKRLSRVGSSPPSPPVWTRFSLERLAKLRLKELGLGPDDGLVGECLVDLSRELERAGLDFRPHVWLSDEWFCPDGVAGFAAPFYLAHPRLMSLERREMKAVEGGTKRQCMRLMRHETGHAIDNAYRLRRDAHRVKIFGDPVAPYPRSYYPKLFSRRFVRYLEFGYAQAHPDEDFAETFAVWLDPKSRWRQRYRDWPALSKLECMEKMMASVKLRRPPSGSLKEIGELSSLGETLSSHYRKKKLKYRIDEAEVFDEDLRAIFSTGTKGKKADTQLRGLRAKLRRRVARWTGLRQYTVDQLIQLWIERSKELGLRGGGRELELELATALAARVSLYVKAGRHRWIL